MRNDLDLDNWRQYLGHLNVGSLWSFAKRGAGGDASYPGNFIPEIPRNLIPRFTKRDDLVVDLFAGSETTADVCAELGRRYQGCDLRPRSTRTQRGDARTWQPSEAAQLVIMHPPYADIIDYNAVLKDPQAGDLSLPTDKFLDEFAIVARNAFNATAPEGYAVLVMGDRWDGKKRELCPLGFLWAGFVLKSITVKDFGNEVANKGKNANLWFYRALKSDFNILEHEYVLTFQRPRS
jgi:hypothetical protein